MQYQRQIQLKEIGLQGQEKLSKTKVLVVGVGGLGCPVSMQLVAAGIGEIGLVDHDKIELSNLPRQTLFSVNDIGENKTKVAKDVLTNFNPNCIINTYPISLTNTNAIDLLINYDIVIDCTDNFSTRYIINDACYLLSKTLVYGSVYAYEGQVSVFNHKDMNGIEANYRHIFPHPPNQKDIPNCNETGVLGVLTGIIGTIQATEVIKLICGIESNLSNRLLTFNLLTYSTQIIKINSTNSIPNSLPNSIKEYASWDYPLMCVELNKEFEIDVQTFNTFLKDENCCIVDVRNVEEYPEFIDSRKIQIPLNQLSNRIIEIPINKPILVICQHGVRSHDAVQYLRNELNHSTIYSLKNGIESWFKQSNS